MLCQVRKYICLNIATKVISGRVNLGKSGGNDVMNFYRTMQNEETITDVMKLMEIKKRLLSDSMY